MVGQTEEVKAPGHVAGHPLLGADPAVGVGGVAVEVPLEPEVAVLIGQAEGIGQAGGHRLAEEGVVVPPVEDLHGRIFRKFTQDTLLSVNDDA